jgi:hypothetical protein
LLVRQRHAAVGDSLADAHADEKGDTDADEPQAAKRLAQA